MKFKEYIESLELEQIEFKDGSYSHIGTNEIIATEVEKKLFRST